MKSCFGEMHQCVNERTFSTWCRESRLERQEMVCCSVCRVVFCCTQDRERHEDAEHGRANVEIARQQRRLRKEGKPLVCRICCQVFVSGLFVNESCNKGAQPDTTEAAGKFSHVLIVIPEWAVKKYLFPSGRKRSWEEINEGVKGDIQVQGNVENLAVNATPMKESSFTQKTSIHSILTKQRKTELSVKRDRRVTFSPITAVAITSIESIIKVESRKTAGEPSPESQTDGLFVKPSNPLSSTEIPAERCADSAFEFSPMVPTDTPCETTFSPLAEHDGKETVVFSPPMPSEGTNGSPMMAPQMSSTPVCNHSFERRTPSTLSSISEYQSSSEAGGPSVGIFSSLTNIICCAFQALPSVLTQFFATVKESDESAQAQSKNAGSVGRERRQRRRSATFTPYLPVPIKKRRWSRKGS